MKYNQLNIYENFGQFDDVVTIIINPKSKDFKIYGSSVTGSIRYKNEERELLQKALKEESDFDKLTKLRIDDNISEFVDKVKYDLFYDGLFISSILKIYSMPFNNTNKYIEKEARNLKEPIPVRINTKGFNALKAFISFNNRSRKDGYKLTYFEEHQDVAYRIIDNNYLIPIEYIDNEDVKFYVLEYKNLYSELTVEEEIEFKEIITNRMKVSTEILLKILNSESKNDLSYLNGRKDIVEILTLLVTYFKPEKLTHTKIPVWWNLERYLHINLGHVSGLMFCINNTSNTPFQYNFKDIKDLIKEILNSLNDEINLHFLEYPNTDFKRQGRMSYYYKGDFYRIHIRKDGLLQTIYKNNKIIK